MDSKPMQASMIPLYKTACLLVHANMSMDKGVEMLEMGAQRHTKREIRSHTAGFHAFSPTILRTVLDLTQRDIRFKHGKDEEDDEE